MANELLERKRYVVRNHTERVAYTIPADLVGNMFQCEEDGSFWKAASAGAGEANWTPLQQKQVAIPLSGFHENDATILAVFADGASTTPGWAVDNSEAPGIRWNNHATPDPVMTVVPIPNDLDADSDITVHILASKSGATLADAVTFDVLAYFIVSGALHDADADAGGTSSAMTGDATAKTVQEVTVTIDSADVSANPAALSISIQPTDGTLGTDDVTVHAVWLEYNAAF